MTLTMDTVKRCGNKQDVDALRQHRVDMEQIVTGISTKCMLNRNRLDCMSQALEDQVGWTAACAMCHAILMEDWIEKCTLICAKGQTPACQACLEQDVPEYQDCVGFVGYG